MRTPDPEASAAARPAEGPYASAGRDPDIVSAEELGALLHLDVQTVRDVSAAEDAAGEQEAPGGAAVVLGGFRVGRQRRYSWSAIYVQIAGPGIPDGEILDAGQLARRLDLPKRAVQRALAPPGTPGKLPGRKVGRQWRSAWPAVQAAIRGPAPAGQPGSPAAR